MTSFLRFANKRVINQIILLLEDGNLYLRLQTMSHTIYAAKFEQTITHQHVLLQRESQPHILLQRESQSY
jgi:hypothetical protein